MNRRFQQRAPYLNAQQPLQQHVAFSNNHMGYNANYSQHVNSNSYSRPAYGNIAAANGTATTTTANPLNNYVMNTASSNGGFSLNPNAPVFQPRYAQTPQQQQPSQVNYASPYSSYMNVQPASGRQQFYNQQPTQQASVYEQPSRTHYLQQVYNAPSHTQFSLQQTIPQSHAPKYQQQSMAMSQALPAYNMDSHQSASQAAYDQNGQDEAYSQFPISDELTNAIQNSNNRMAITEVQIGLEQLCTDVHEYNLWGNAIKSRVASGLSSEDANLVAWLLVEMSYLGTGTQYNFSRLCKLLDAEIKGFTTQLVIPRINQFIASGVEKLSHEHLGNFVLFLGELYDKIEVNGVRVSRL